MLSKSHLAMAKKVIEADIHYGRRFAKVPILDPKQATELLEPGDALIQFAPQLRLSMDYYNEYILKGCMHLSTIAFFGDRPYKIELIQQGLFCVNEIFEDLDRQAIYMKRYYLVLRHKRVQTKPELQLAINESALRFAGFEDRDGVPVRTRHVEPNFFLKTHRSMKGRRQELPKKIYCSEITYLAYRENGIEICELRTLEELFAKSGGLPSWEATQKIWRRYTRSSGVRYGIMMVLSEIERLGNWLNLSFLRPSRLISDRVVFPQFVLENRDFELVMIVPPSKPYIVQWNRMLLYGEGPEPETKD
jgi:hypothetical protein